MSTARISATLTQTERDAVLQAIATIKPIRNSQFAITFCDGDLDPLIPPFIGGEKEIQFPPQYIGEG